MISAENYKQFHITRKYSMHREDKDKEATRGHVMKAFVTFWAFSSVSHLCLLPIYFKLGVPDLFLLISKTYRHSCIFPSQEVAPNPQSGARSECCWGANVELRWLWGECVSTEQLDSTPSCPTWRKLINHPDVTNKLTTCPFNASSLAQISHHISVTTAVRTKLY